LYQGEKILKSHHDEYEFQPMLHLLMGLIDELEAILNIDVLHSLLYNCQDLIEYSKQLKRDIH
jgi:hypothetical protein